MRRRDQELIFFLAQMTQTILGEHSQPWMRRFIASAAVPGGSKEEHHGPRGHCYRDGLLGLRRSILRPAMTSRHHPGRSVFFGKVGHREREENLQLRVR